MIEKLKAKKFIFLIVGVVFFVLWIGGSILTANNGPEKVIKKMEKAVIKKDAKLLADCFQPEPMVRIRKLQL